jgi:hypothetical protein
MDMGRRSGRSIGGLGGGTLAVAAAGGYRTTAAAQPSALEEKTRGQPGESDQEENQRGNI